MTTELNLRFQDEGHVEVRLGEEESGRLSFTNPITYKVLRDLQWYVEVYGAHSLGDPDEVEACSIAQQLGVGARFVEGERQPPGSGLRADDCEAQHPNDIQVTSGGTTTHCS